jgi:hypothetical protein
LGACFDRTARQSGHGRVVFRGGRSVCAAYCEYGESGSAERYLLGRAALCDIVAMGVAHGIGVLGLATGLGKNMCDA